MKLQLIQTSEIKLERDGSETKMTFITEFEIISSFGVELEHCFLSFFCLRLPDFMRWRNLIGACQCSAHEIWNFIQ